MTKQQLLKDFKFQFTARNIGGILVAVTALIRLNNNRVLGQLKTEHNIYDVNDWIVDSQSPISFPHWDWNKVIGQTKRYQLDDFAINIPIDDFLPLNSENDISEFYI